MPTRTSPVRTRSKPAKNAKSAKAIKPVSSAQTRHTATPGKKLNVAADVAANVVAIARKRPLPEASSPSSLIDLWLGERLRLRRKELRKPLQQVADACDISVSLLSQIERGLRSISLRTLNALASELDVQPETLVMNARHRPENVHASGMVTRAGHHPCIEMGDRGIEKTNLTPRLATGVIGLYRALIEPGGSTGSGLFTTGAEEQVGYVVGGQLELFIDDQLLMLKAGDSFVYHGATPRKWRNPGVTKTTVLWAISAI